MTETAIAVAVETGDPIGRVMSTVVADESDEDYLEPLVERLNELEMQQSVPLSELSLTATRMLLELRRERWSDPDAEQTAELAALCRDVAMRLAAIGQAEEALPYDHLSVVMFRKSDSERYGVELGSSLNNLSNRLAQVGLHEEALAASIDSAEIFEDIEKVRPGVYLSLFAQSLHNMASRLRAFGLRDRALTVMVWAIERRRVLFEQDGAHHRASLATSLDGKGVILSELGSFEEAVLVLTEAADHWRWLAEARPDSHLASLARTLNTLSLVLASLDQQAAGVAAASESVEIYRRLADERPEKFTGNLARALVNLGQGLASEAGIPPLVEAVTHFQRMAERSAAVYTRPWLSSRVLLAGRYLATGDIDKALSFLEPSHTKQRELVEAGQAEVRPSLALCLHTRALVLDRLGNTREAISSLQEAIQLQTELAEERVSLFEPLLEASHKDLAKLLDDSA